MHDDHRTRMRERVPQTAHRKSKAWLRAMPEEVEYLVSPRVRRMVMTLAFTRVEWVRTANTDSYQAYIIHHGKSGFKEANIDASR